MEWFCRAGKLNHIFGYGQGSVKVEFCGKTYETQSKGEKWIVELLPQSYCDDLEIVVMLNFEKRTIKKRVDRRSVFSKTCRVERS